MMTVKQRGSSPQAAAAADAAGSVHLSSPAASGPSAEDPAAESASAAANVPSQPSHAAHGCSLQLVQRAASLPASDSTTDGLHSEIAGEYCMRLPVADKAELSTAIISDTVAALPVAPESVSHVQGPVLEVHQVDDHSVDIKIVHSFRASYAQPIDEVRQTAARSWQQRAHHGGDGDAADKTGTASDSSSGSSSRQQWHPHGRGVHLHRGLQHHAHHHHHHHHVHEHNSRASSVEHCVECTEIVDSEECMLPPDIKRCAACVVHEHDTGTGTEAHDAEHLQPSSNSSCGMATQPHSIQSRRSSAATAEPAAAEDDEDDSLLPGRAFVEAVQARHAASPSPFAGASPFAASPFQAAGEALQPFSLPDAPGAAPEVQAVAAAATAAAAASKAQQGAGSGDVGAAAQLPQHHWQRQRHPKHQQHQQQQVSFAPPDPSGRQRGGGRLSVEVLRTPDSRTDSGGEHVVSPTAISDASDDVAAQLQQWQREHMCSDDKRLGYHFQRHQLLQQLLQQPSSEVMYPDAAAAGHHESGGQQQHQPVHVRLTHKRTAHGHEQVQVSPAAGPAADASGPDRPQQQQRQLVRQLVRQQLQQRQQQRQSDQQLQQQQQQQQQRQSDQQLQLVRQQQQWMQSPQLQQQVPWEAKLNQLDMNVLRPPAGFAPLSGQKLPEYVLAHPNEQQWQQQQPSQEHSNSLALAEVGRPVDRFAPHPGLVAHLQGKTPIGHRAPALGFQPRCEWELDPRKVLVGRRLAVGGFAEVFLGKYEGTVVAIKRLLTDDATTIERFVSEVRLLARLRHPNLILFMGYCITPELCIVSEYMSKGSLYGVLYSPEQRKQRAAARAGRSALPAGSSGSEQQQGPEDEAGGDGGRDAAVGEGGSQLLCQPSLAEGQLPLSEEIRCQEQSLDPKLQRVVAISVARGMAYLHTRSPPILHLDLKSPNILLDDRWRVKITDFGLSRARSKTVLSSTAQGGTPEWMAPEVLRCEDVAEPADVYSFGVVLWELITGRPPWENYNAMQVVAMVGFRDMCLPLPASAADPFLLDLCRRCLHRNPQQRPTFTDIVSQLDQNYGPPAWASHAQPLLPPTLRLPLPAAAASAARASTGREGLVPGADGAAAGAAAALPGRGSAKAAALPAEAPHGSESWEAPNDSADAAGGHGSVEPTLEHHQQHQQQEQPQRGNLAVVREVPAAAAAAVAAWAKEQQHPQQEQEQQSNAAAAPAPAAAAPAKLFSPFGGAAFPPWSVESVDSLAPAAPQAPDSLAGSGTAAAAAQPPVSRAHLLRQPSSSDTSSSSSCAAERQGAAAAPGDSIAVSTQPGSASNASLLLQRQAAKQAGVLSGATADAAVVTSPPASVTGVTGAHAAAAHQPELWFGSSAFEQEQQQQQQSGLSPQPAAGGVSSLTCAASPASSDSSVLGLSSRDSSPFEQVQFAPGSHVYTTPVKIGTPLSQRDDPAATQQRQQSDVAHPAPGAAGSPAPAAAGTGTAQASAAAAGPFGVLAHQPLSSGTDGSTEPAYHHAAQQGQDVCQVCVPYGTRLGSADGVSTPPPAGSEAQHAAAPGHDHAAAAAAAAAPAGASTDAGAPAAAAGVGPGRVSSQHFCQPVLRNGPASAPCAPMYMLPEQAGAHAWLDDTGSFSRSITAVSAGSKLPSDASLRRNFWPSMTATDASAHSLTALAGLGAGSERPGGAGSSRNSSRRSSSSSLGDGSSNGPAAVGSSSSGGTGAGVGGRPVAVGPAAGNGSTQGQAVQGAAVEAADGNALRAGQEALAAGAPRQGEAEPLPMHTLQHQQPLQPQQPAQQLSQQQQQQLSSSQQVYQVWPVLGNGQQWQQAPALLQEASGVSYRPNGAFEGSQHQSSSWDTATSPAGLSQPKPPTHQQQQVFGRSKTPAPPGSLRSSLGCGQHVSVGHSRSTSFQRKGRFMVSTMTPEPPGVDEGPSGGASPAAAAAAGSPAGLAAAGGLTSSLQMMSACSGLQSPSSWLLGAGMQPGWPLLGSSVSAPPPNVDLVSAQQQQQLMMQQHERGLAMQMSAPASLGGLASQPGTPASTPTGAASESAAPWHTPRLQACDSADLQFSLRVSDPACRRLAGKGYWGSGIMREPSAALLDSSSGSRSLRGSHEGFEEPTGSRPLQQQQQQQDKPFSSIRSNAAWAAMLQSVSSSSGGGSTGLCYRSGRFHVTVEQLQAWQQRQAQLQQQHAHLPHKSNSTGALLAAAGLATAGQSPSAAAVHTAGTDTGAVAPQAPQQKQQQQQQPQARPLHPSASCSSLQHQPLQQPQQQQQGQGEQGPGMPAGQQAKQLRGKATPAGPAAAPMPVGSAHTDEHGTDIRSYCDVKGSSTGSSMQSGSSTSTAQGTTTAATAAAMTSSSSASCLRLKAATAAKATATGSLAHPAPPGPGRPPVVPSSAACKTPSPAATPCLSPRLQRAKSRDYCKGRFQVHESPVVGHGRGQDHKHGPANSGPSHSICMGQLQQLQQQAQQSLQSLSEQEPLLQPRASSPPDLEAPPVSTTPAAGGGQDSLGREGGVQLADVGSSAGLGATVAPHARSTASHGSSGGVSDAGSGSAASCTPTAAAAGGASALSSAGGGGAASAAAVAAVVQQRGRFTVRQESRPGSRPGSAQGSKAASPRGTQQHPACDRLSKLGSKSCVDFCTAFGGVEGPAPCSSSQPAVSRTGAGSEQQQHQQLQGHGRGQHGEQQQQQLPLQATGVQPAARPVSADGSGMGISSGLLHPTAAGAAAEAAAASILSVGDHSTLPPIKTVSKKGRFVVTQLTPATTTCCTPTGTKSAAAATTPTGTSTAGAAAGGSVFAEGRVAAAAAAAGAGASAAIQGLSISPYGPLVTCPVCAVAQVIPQLPHQLSGQLLGLVTEPNSRALHEQQLQQQAGAVAPQQAGGQQSSQPDAAAAAAACDVIAAAVSGVQSVVGRSIQGSCSGTPLDPAAGGSSSSVFEQQPAQQLHSCSSCGAPLPPMSQQEYQSAAAAAAAGVLDTAAGMQAGRMLTEATGGSIAMHEPWNEAAAAAAAGGPTAHGATDGPGSSPSTPQGLLAMAAAKVLAARQQQQLLQLQRQQRESHDASTGPSSSSRTPGLHSRRSFEPPWPGYGSGVAGFDLLSESSYQQSSLSSARSSSSSIAAMACSRPMGCMQGHWPTGGMETVAAAGASAAALALGSGCRTPVQSSSPAGFTPAASAAASPVVHTTQQQVHTAFTGSPAPSSSRLATVSLSAAGGVAAGAAAAAAGTSSAAVADESTSACLLPRSHPGAWMDALGSADASSSGDCSGSSSSSSGSGDGCSSPVNTPAH